MRSIESREPFVFNDTVVKGTTLKLEELMEISCRAKRLRINIPPGPENALRIRAYFITSKETPREYVKFVGSKNYFDGDDVTIDINLDVPIEAYSKLVVEATNTTDPVTGFDYSLDVVIEVQYEVGA